MDQHDDSTNRALTLQQEEAERSLRALPTMSHRDLRRLARRLRQRIITTVAKTGGHLASNLGVVELTIALHRAFQSPRDKIIWDVGHQSYVHKLLTGRAHRFATLRQFGGLSGFPKRHESVHDVFETGHSSTSISAALGMAIARDIKGEDHHVVAVIGDGALTGGMAFEALNQAGQSPHRLIVILNDNEMSISANVGGLSKHLNMLRVQPGYFRTKSGVKSLLQHVPRGESIINAIQMVKASAQHLVLPGLYFEDLGLSYLGPIDGHSFESLDFILEQAKELEGPVLIHVCTTKGKGFDHAEKSPKHFHGMAPFDIDSGKPLQPSSTSFTKVFSNTMLDLAKDYPDLVAISAAMPDGTGLSPFAEIYPERFFDVGIAEQHAVTLAAGMASAGLRPVVAVYSTFLQRAFDQIAMDVALQNLPVTFAVDRAGLVGEDGETHHGMFDISYLRLIPNMHILAPRNYSELRGMMHVAQDLRAPVALRYPRGQGEEGEQIQDYTQLLSSEICISGTDRWIIAVGSLTYSAISAAQALQKQGISWGVINLRSIKPLDTDTLLPILHKAIQVVTLEENTIIGGAGSAIVELCQTHDISAQVLTLGLPDRFIEQGSRDQLMEMLQLDTGNLILRIEQFSRTAKEDHTSSEADAALLTGNGLR